MKIVIELDYEHGNEKHFNRAMQALRDYITECEKAGTPVRRWFIDEKDPEFFGKAKIL
jgi:hypothetical protein